MIKESLINFLKSKRDKKRHEVLRLRWQKAELERQLELLKATKAKQQRDD